MMATIWNGVIQNCKPHRNFILYKWTTSVVPVLSIPWPIETLTFEQRARTLCFLAHLSDLWYTNEELTNLHRDWELQMFTIIRGMSIEFLETGSRLILIHTNNLAMV